MIFVTAFLLTLTCIGVLIYPNLMMIKPLVFEYAFGQFPATIRSLHLLVVNELVPNCVSLKQGVGCLLTENASSIKPLMTFDNESLQLDGLSHGISHAETDHNNTFSTLYKVNTSAQGLGTVCVLLALSVVLFFVYKLFYKSEGGDKNVDNKLECVLDGQGTALIANQCLNEKHYEVAIDNSSTAHLTEYLAVENEYDEWVNSEVEYENAVVAHLTEYLAVENEYDEWVNSEVEYENAVVAHLTESLTVADQHHVAKDERCNVRILRVVPDVTDGEAEWRKPIGKMSPIMKKGKQVPNKYKILLRPKELRYLTEAFMAALEGKYPSTCFAFSPDRISTYLSGSESDVREIYSDIQSEWRRTQKEKVAIWTEVIRLYEEEEKMFLNDPTNDQTLGCLVGFDLNGENNDYIYVCRVAPDYRKNVVNGSYGNNLKKVGKQFNLRINLPRDGLLNLRGEKMQVCNAYMFFKQQVHLATPD